MEARHGVPTWVTWTNHLFKKRNLSRDPTITTAESSSNGIPVTERPYQIRGPGSSITANIHPHSYTERAETQHNPEQLGGTTWAEAQTTKPNRVLLIFSILARRELILGVSQGRQCSDPPGQSRGDNNTDQVKGG
ncbi:hypothetical protein QJS10_CPB13g01257 [Acorus calamus]|uniref:Uncharacterized protein n=1 Tax=Acorus calamus TaxID=4465 RepID=A0AAV9DE99_ACOCL|nr:hypothetical protein QJS10_CPB13g01257 [Acorus calamus]